MNIEGLGKSYKVYQIIVYELFAVLMRAPEHADECAA